MYVSLIEDVGGYGNLLEQHVKAAKMGKLAINALLLSPMLFATGCTSPDISTTNNSGRTLVDLARTQPRALTVHTSDGDFHIPKAAQFALGVDGAGTLYEQQTVSMYIDKPVPLPDPADARVSPTPLGRGVSVTVAFNNSSGPGTTSQGSASRSAQLTIPGRGYVNIIGTNLDCSLDNAYAFDRRGKGSQRQSQTIETRISWAVDGMPLYLSCLRELSGPAQDRVLLNCNGGTVGQRFGRGYFVALDQATGDCLDGLARLVTALSFFPDILKSWRTTAPVGSEF